MKTTLFLLTPFVFLVSCASQQGVTGGPVAPAASTAGNQFGVPSVPVPTAPVYQPIGPINPPALPSAPSIPTYTAPTAAAPLSSASDGLNGNVHTISKGESLWGISRKYGTTVDALKASNGLSSDTIIDGRTLIIPGR